MFGDVLNKRKTRSTRYKGGCQQTAPARKPLRGDSTNAKSSWLLLLIFANVRIPSREAIRTMPPSASATYARGHDDAIWTTLQAMLGGMGDAEAAHARQVAALPGALGGLGLLSAEAIAPAVHCLQSTHACPQARPLMCASSSPKPEMARTALQKQRLPDMAYAARRSLSCPASVPWCRRLAARLAVPPLPYTLAIAFLAAQFALLRSRAGPAPDVRKWLSAPGPAWRARPYSTYPVLANLLYFQDVPLESSGNFVRSRQGCRIDWRFRAGF
eukprot:s1438_g14.t1